MRIRLIIAACILVLLAGAGFVLLSGTPEGRRDRLLRRLNSQEILIRRSCGSGEAYVDGPRWNRLDPEDKERAASAIASWCAEQGGQNTLTVLDVNTRANLGRWSGTAFEGPR